jgi:hypothetical protein
MTLPKRSIVLIFLCPCTNVPSPSNYFHCELYEKCVCFICILLYCNRLYFILTVATFPATYIQQLGRSLQKNEKLVTVCLSRSNFALIHLSQRNTPASKKYTCIWNTSFMCRHFNHKAHSDSYNNV